MSIFFIAVLVSNFYHQSLFYLVFSNPIGIDVNLELKLIGSSYIMIIQKMQYEYKKKDPQDSGKVQQVRVQPGIYR